MQNGPRDRVQGRPSSRISSADHGEGNGVETSVLGSPEYLSVALLNGVKEIASLFVVNLWEDGGDDVRHVEVPKGAFTHCHGVSSADARKLRIASSGELFATGERDSAIEISAGDAIGANSGGQRSVDRLVDKKRQVFKSKHESWSAPLVSE